ncbi:MULTISPECIES: TetR/AcrR family transcriptional regulator [Rhizobium]|uniref:TetR/AcrR family transcriptional regulator n=1 Tax=Rhizobium TaxID=379 RepID=UPI0007EA3A1B|nr:MULTISPECIES: TetR/AcrR family transcriptional regulator [Rhizobium]ANK95430.1 TetR family transcriptional regulator protein [Rhizobium sp. N6212]ANL01483.1 TetR family transcriptional regulator protein [Rhizobium sp. N621]ANL07606.1 TetR family transcriptional regulator protein [Rhizobium esperanzae]ANL13776.1 TetR family transcriptional regulator protein [Rhizobium sp. N1341]ANM38447.1 TetR family transcriptional regulator protein [Rhizobium sp. N871]
MAEQKVEQQEKRRRRSRKGEERRAEILAAAMRRFAEDGYQNAAIGDIARDVGLSLPGLLHHFPTKVDLLLAILAKRDVDSADFIGHYRSDVSGLLKGMVEIFRRNAGMIEVIRAFAILNAESLMKDHPAKAWFLARTTEMQNDIAATFERAIADGSIDKRIDSKTMAAELIAVMDGLQMLWLRDPDRFDMIGGLKAYVGRLLASLGLEG